MEQHVSSRECFHGTVLYLESVAFAESDVEEGAEGDVQLGC